MDSARAAVGWTVVNRMKRNDTDLVNHAWRGYRHGKPATASARIIAEAGSRRPFVSIQVLSTARVGLLTFSSAATRKIPWHKRDLWLAIPYLLIRIGERRGGPAESLRFALQFDSGSHTARPPLIPDDRL